MSDGSGLLRFQERHPTKLLLQQAPGVLASTCVRPCKPVLSSDRATSRITAKVPMIDNTFRNPGPRMLLTASEEGQCICDHERSTLGRFALKLGKLPGIPCMKI